MYSHNNDGYGLDSKYGLHGRKELKSRDQVKINERHVFEKKEEQNRKKQAWNNHFCVIIKNEWKLFYILSFQWQNQKIFHFFCLYIFGVALDVVVVVVEIICCYCCCLTLTIQFYHNIWQFHFSAIKKTNEWQHFGRHVPKRHCS